MTLRPTAVAAIALATLCAWAPAQAAGPVHIEASSLTFDTDASARAETLVSDVGGVVTFSLPNPADSLGQDGSYFGFFHHTYNGQFQLNARAGYKITGYALSGEFGGAIRVSPIPQDQTGTLGVATTRASLSLADSRGAAPVLTHSLADLNGVDGFTLASAPLDHAGALTLQLGGFVYGFNMPTTTEQGWTFSSTANIALADSLRLTVYTTTVPEPHSYALMLAGLALVGGIARRRKRA